MQLTPNRDNIDKMEHFCEQPNNKALTMHLQKLLKSSLKSGVAGTIEPTNPPSYVEANISDSPSNKTLSQVRSTFISSGECTRQTRHMPVREGIYNQQCHHFNNDSITDPEAARLSTMVGRIQVDES